MLNTRDLEERWLKYKIKSYIPHATIILSLVVILIMISIFTNSNKEEKKITSSSQIIAKKQIENIKTVVTKVAEKTLPKKEIVQIKEIVVEEVPKSIAVISKKNTLKSNETTLKLTPSLDFMKKMQHSSLPYYQDNTQVQQEVQNSPPTYTSQPIEEIQELDVAVEENIQTPTIEIKTNKISITRKNSEDDIRHIIKRFKKNNNPALSLFVAKKYYELGEYHKAYNYALITNEIDREIDASWLIFAKSLVKLNQKEMAIKTLKKYIEDSSSSSAKILHEEIISGKFK